jgi:hypothetical protein
MAFEHKDNSGSLFENDRKRKDSDPDMKGDGMFAGVDVWLSGWRNKTKSGQEYIKLTMRAKDSNAYRKPESEPEPEPDAGDAGGVDDKDMPF